MEGLPTYYIIYTLTERLAQSVCNTYEPVLAETKTGGRTSDLKNNGSKVVIFIKVAKLFMTLLTFNV